jgi:hypothetical protein
MLPLIVLDEAGGRMALALLADREIRAHLSREPQAA